MAAGFGPPLFFARSAGKASPIRAAPVVGMTANILAGICGVGWSLI